MVVLGGGHVRVRERGGDERCGKAGRPCRVGPLSSEFGTTKTVKAEGVSLSGMYPCMPRVLGASYEGGRFLVCEVPLYTHGGRVGIYKHLSLSRTLAAAPTRPNPSTPPTPHTHLSLS